MAILFCFFFGKSLCYDCAVGQQITFYSLRENFNVWWCFTIYTCGLDIYTMEYAAYIRFLALSIYVTKSCTHIRI